MLGTDLAAACRRSGLVVRVFDLPGFDMTDPDQLREAVASVDTVVNCAAYTDVDAAESHFERAYQVNAEAVGHLGELAGAAGKWVLHISTDFVFDGRSDRPYTESDAPNPMNAYGRTKLAGERLLGHSGCEHCIVRVEWTYGTAGNNFPRKLLERARSGQALKVVDDQVGSPTATTEIAAVLCELLESRPTGLFHFASAGYVSRYEMAKFMFDRLGMTVNLSPCKTGDFRSPAPRPLNSRFDCSKIRGLLGTPIEPWQGPLERFLRRL